MSDTQSIQLDAEGDMYEYLLEQAELADELEFMYPPRD